MRYPKVSVLMSTYNGEKYIREQIDSILCQVDVEIYLLIRDDGSRDNTTQICTQYAQQYTNVEFYQGDNLGVGKSFLELLKKAPQADYYSFADQDDVWLEDKLIRAVEIIQKCQFTSDSQDFIRCGESIIASEKCDYQEGQLGRMPILYASNQQLVDEHLNNIGMRFNVEPKHGCLDTINRNKVSGCTMVMNNELRDIIRDENRTPSEEVISIRLHDTWSSIVANISGRLIYDEKARILYRQHGQNVVGGIEKKELANSRIRCLNSKKRKIKELEARLQ